MAGVAATVVSNGLWLLPSGLLSALGLCFLGALGLCFLGALGLCFLGTLWLCFLCVLRLLLVLRRLRFSSASALFLLAFLCECRKGGSEK
jgi:hypothetical protein